LEHALVHVTVGQLSHDNSEGGTHFEMWGVFYLFIYFILFLKLFVTPDRITIQILLNRLSKFGLDL